MLYIIWLTFCWGNTMATLTGEEEELVEHGMVVNRVSETATVRDPALVHQSELDREVENNTEQERVSTVIPRLNAGVIFHLERQMSLTTHIWWHSLFLRLPARTLYERRSYSAQRAACNTIKDPNAQRTCLNYQPLLINLYELDKAAADNIHGIIEHMYELIPEMTGEIKRVKRSLLPWVGRGLKSLFGVGTSGDIKDVQAHMVETEKLTQLMSDNLANNVRSWSRRHV